MEDWVIKLVQQNAVHIETINQEMGELIIRLTVVEQKVNLILAIVSFVGASLGALFIAYCWKKLFKSNNNKK